MKIMSFNEWFERCGDNYLHLTDEQLYQEYESGRDDFIDTIIQNRKEEAMWEEMNK